MTGIKICTRHSEIPYHIKEHDINVYSIEELAYYLYNYACFIDRDFFTSELMEYIEENLRKPKLAYKLKYAMEQRMHYSEYILAVVEDSMYYDEKEIIDFKRSLEEMKSKNSEERLKARGDMLFENNRYGSALVMYYDILKMQGGAAILSDNLEKNAFYGSVYNGIGKVRARMFNYESALDAFRVSYMLSPDRNTAKLILNSVLMMRLSDEEKNKRLNEIEKELSIAKEIERECRDEIKNLEEQIVETDEYNDLMKVSIYEGKRNLDDYYKDVENIIDDWKEEYRNQML